MKALEEELFLINSFKWFICDGILRLRVTLTMCWISSSLEQQSNCAVFFSFKKITGIWCLSICREFYDLHHYCNAFVNVYVDLEWGQGFVSSTSPGVRPVPVWDSSLGANSVPKHCCSPSPADGWLLLPASFQMGHRQKYLTLASSFSLFPLSLHRSKSVSSILFSLWSISEECLAERLQLKFSFCFHDSTWGVSPWLGLP